MTVHEATDACIADHCHWHDVDEPGSGYILCGECGHLYRTARELRRAYRRAVMTRRRFGVSWWFCLLHAVTVRAGRVSFCQHCIHDF